ncbi:MAG TPA: PQQ-binding-like beta-propeller repeat protein [Candidatus Baltobacteraceae bacterium]|jgi:outer membrane protein assembly factor BamB|nr:PQQ-binding-like beta-propeller repeat protein [Candidatus Baltobacteraceae bacterium]
MSTAQPIEPSYQKPLRLWPGVVIVAIQWLLRFVLPVFVPEALGIGVIGGLVCGFLVVVWWLCFSRAAWSERLGALALIVVGMVATSRLVDVSIATGMMGLAFPIYAIPVLCLAFVVWAVATRRLAAGVRRITMVATILLACGVWTLLRTGGVTGSFASDLSWRWSKTPEERLLSQAAEAPAALQAASAAPESGADWPGFRGPHRDGIVPGVRIETNWAASPPVELWRRPIGPGWSSLAVHGNLLYTQEQRGEDEVVACYDATTGKPVWAHRDAARFWESNGGAGPRSTPALGNGRVYAFGATGILNALDARNGALLWSSHPPSDTDTRVPGWGFAGSPLVVGDVVIVAAVGRLAAYDIATGARRWVGPVGGDGYSSPQLFMIDGVAQVVLLSGQGAVSVAPTDGTLLWEYPWHSGARIVQPALVPNGDILISASGAGGGVNMRCLAVRHRTGGWAVEERWTSVGLKPYFNDFVVYDGCAFGFDGSILACIDLQDGKRKWKGGRYGSGQLLLLPDQGLLLVLSEQGELALVRASPDEFTELGRFPAIKGKTWNHPVLAGDLLLVRNGQEMAAFRLALQKL